MDLSVLLMLRELLSGILHCVGMELLESQLTRAELVDLACLSWRQIEESGCTPIGDLVDLDRCRWGVQTGVVESLAANEAPVREGWLEWLATVVACLILLWEQEGRTRPFRFLEKDWRSEDWKWTFKKWPREE